jgi:hypothetical protein
MNLRAFSKLCIASILLLAISRNGNAEESKPKEVRKRIFTNEDLQKLSEKYRGDLHPAETANVNAVDPKPKSDTTSPALIPEKFADKALWAAKLQTVDNDVAKFKAAETKFSSALDKYTKNRVEAKSEFHKQTAEFQIADSEKNLAWAKADLKKAEEERAKILSEAAKRGFKPEELKQDRKEELPPQP